MANESGERKPLLRKKSIIPVTDQGSFSEFEAKIMTSDMADDMQEFAIDCAMKALSFNEFTNEKEIASYIRTRMEEKYTPIWHCIVGRTFGTFVSHESNHYIYFIVGKTGILIFKCG